MIKMLPPTKAKMNKAEGKMYALVVKGLPENRFYGVNPLVTVSRKGDRIAVGELYTDVNGLLRSRCVVTFSAEDVQDMSGNVLLTIEQGKPVLSYYAKATGWTL